MKIMKKYLCLLLALIMVSGWLSARPKATGIRQSQDVSDTLQETLGQLAATVTEPTFGTNAGEWTVFCLARGNYFPKDSLYFSSYYDRITEYVSTTATTLDKNGALDKNKSTDNARLIVALSAIGKDATDVGGWDLVEAYSANGMNWIRKQGMNGTIWALIALDCGGYEASDPTIRQQCIDSILSLQHNDGGWSLVTAKAQPSNVDITGMTLTALYPYRDQPAVAAACEKALTWLSESQLANGGFPYGNGETSESCVWAIVACTTWGINPDTDPRFVKNGTSAVDNLLTYYLPDEARFAHIRGAGSNAMATDQCTYALVAYDRFVNRENILFDYSDVQTPEQPDPTPDQPDPTPETPSPATITAALTLPAKVNGNSRFNGFITADSWDNDAGYKLIDLVINLPGSVSVAAVTAGERLSGGQLCWNVDQGKLRVVYFDAAQNSDLTVTEGSFPAELFTVSFQAENVPAGIGLSIGISGMSVKRNSDPCAESAMVVVNTENASANVQVVAGIAFSAMCLYTGDGVDLIPAGKKSVAIAVTGISDGAKLSFNDGSHTFDLQYSQQITDKTGIATYIALVDASVPMENFVKEDYLTISADSAESLCFGDANGDGVVNAQDALAVVDAWLRKGETPTDDRILAMNVNGDSRINTFDALAIAEAFVSKKEYLIITKAASAILP